MMRYFATLRVRSLLKTLALAGFVGTLLLCWAMMNNTSLAQTPRPTLTFTPPPTNTPGPTAQPRAATGYTGPNLKGQVVDLSTDQPVGGATVVFTTDSISVEAITDKDGKYTFDLGAANGLLNVISPHGSGLKPATADVAVRTKIGVELVVNLGVSPNGSGAPPLIPTVRVSPDSVRAGENMTITVIIKNTLPEAISNAIVTNWLPASLVPVSVHSSTGNSYYDNNLAIAELGRLNPGDGALVEIVAQANQTRATASQLQGKVSFYYRENTAAQAQALGGLNGAAPTVLPVTGVGLPLIGLVLIVTVIIVGWLRRRISHAPLAH